MTLPTSLTSVEIDPLLTPSSYIQVRNRKGKLLGIQAAAENTGARTSHRGEARIPEYPVVDPLHATGPNRIMAIADSPSVEGCPSLQASAHPSLRFFYVIHFRNQASPPGP